MRKTNALRPTDALQLLTQACDTQPLHFLWRPQLHDVADEMVLETAINGRVDKLVTFNQRHQHALRDAISMDYFVSLAVAEKIASINSWEQKTGKALDSIDMAEMRGLLDKAGNQPPQPGDEKRI